MRRTTTVKEPGLRPFLLLLLAGLAGPAVVLAPSVAETVPAAPPVSVPDLPPSSA